MKSKHIIYIALGTLLILSIPLIAMQFTDTVDWKLPDFIIIGTLLFGTGLAYELIANKLKTTNQRLIAGTLLLAFVLLAWAELAVGIFNTSLAGQ